MSFVVWMEDIPLHLYTIIQVDLAFIYLFIFNGINSFSFLKKEKKKKKEKRKGA